MLFQLAPNTPRFEVFNLLNAELLQFIEKSINETVFCRELFSNGVVGQACWDNARENNPKAKSDLTREKFRSFFAEIRTNDIAIRQHLYEVMRDNQNLQNFFEYPNYNLLDFLPSSCLESLKKVTTHLYCATKDLTQIIATAGNIDITAHFNAFRREDTNGNVCKACGMEKLAPFRASVADDNQWRADYDHQLCKSKYPIFAVHPDNLVPLCRVCNQDAKKAKDIFRKDNDVIRFAFYPYVENASHFVDISVENLRDPEPYISVNWRTNDALVIEKLNTWDEIYEIRSRVEGEFRSIATVITDVFTPTRTTNIEERIQEKSIMPLEATLKRKEWAFWHHKLFLALSNIDIAPFMASLEFVNQQGSEGAEYILGTE